MRSHEALVSSEAIPSRCLNVVLRNTAASVVQMTKPILRGGVTLLSQQAKKRKRCYVGIVEARTITRRCFENQYWVVALAEQGEAFARTQVGA